MVDCVLCLVTLAYHTVDRVETYVETDRLRLGLRKVFLFMRHCVVFRFVL